jgi:signal transduction histidine kinase
VLNYKCICIAICFFLGIAKVYTQEIALADSIFFKDNHIEAINAYTTLIEKYGKPKTLEMGNVYFRRGISYDEVRNYNAALQDYFIALPYFENIGNKERIASVAHNIGNMYFKQTNYEEANKFYNQAHKIRVQLKDTISVIDVQNCLALTSAYLGDTIRAIQIHKQTIETYKDKINFPKFTNHFINLANCYIEQNKDSAIYYYDQAYKNAFTNDDSSAIGTIYVNIGDLYKAKRDFTKALFYFNRSKEITLRYSDSSLLTIIYHNLSDVYDSLKQYNKAYYYAIQERNINDILFNKEKNEISAELSAKYESDKKDAQIKQQITENNLKSRTIWFTITGLILAIALASVSFYNYRRKQKVNKQLIEQKNYIEGLNAKLEQSNQVKTKLFSIVSHDLRSPISSLYAYLHMSKQKGVEKNTNLETVHAQSEVLLETLEDLLIWSKSQLEAFKIEPAHFLINDVLQEVLDFFVIDIGNKKIMLQNSITEKMPIVTDRNMFTIMLRNVIANAIKHAISKTVLKIDVHNSANDLILEVVNHTSEAHAHVLANHVTVKDVNSKNQGLGTILIKDFITQLGGTVQYHIEANIIKTTITLPNNINAN